jgi:peroxiredoxin
MIKHLTSFILLFGLTGTLMARKAIVSGDIRHVADSITIRCSFIQQDITEPVSAVTIPVINGKFSYTFDIKGLVFIGFEESGNFYGGFLEPGDSIFLTYDSKDLKNSIRYSGKGKEKFSLCNNINNLKGAFRQEGLLARDKKFPVDYFFSKTDSAGRVLTKQAEAVRPYISPAAFTQLRAYLSATLLRANYNEGILAITGNYTYDEYLIKEKARLSPESRLMLTGLFTFNPDYSNSYFYLKAVYNLLSGHFDNNYQSDSTGNYLLPKYEYITKFLKGKLKSPVLFQFMKAEPTDYKPDEMEQLIERSFVKKDDIKYKVILLEKLAFSKTLKQGAAAPDFSLENLSGEKISLQTFNGKVVYIDFWFANCVPCLSLFKEINPVKDYFKPDSNVVFLSVSIDTREDWKKAVARLKIPGVHAYTENKLRDHPVIKSYNVIEYPTTLLIGRNGELFSTKPAEKAGELQKEIEQALLKSN